jgi:hypothetical protein
MKKILFLIFFIASTSPLSASEMIGSISTNPNNIVETHHGTSLHEEGNDSATSFGHGDGSDDGIDEEDDDLETGRDTSVPEIIVLGFSDFADGSLLRGSDAKIYLIKGDYKKHIQTLLELEKYSGQNIFNVSDDILIDYKTRRHLDGDLIRAVGTVEVFYIVDGRLKHVLSLEELRSNFFGQEIFNIKSDEFSLYL